MKPWLSEKLEQLSKLDNYIRPERIKNSIKLDANENFVLNRNFISEIALQAIKYTDLREYPIEQFEKIYKQLAEYIGISKKYLAIGNGSDQIIELILSIIGREQRATVFTPTFSYFINRCKLHDVTVTRVPLNKTDNTIRKVEFLNSAKRSDVVYICSPNNPTGNQFDKRLVLEIIDILEDKLIVVDEAYVEFADYSLTSDVVKYNNIVILRTLSKAFGLAGARIGYLISNEKFAQVFRSIIQSPYPVNSLSLTIASMILSNYSYIKDTIELIKNERKRVFDHLAKLNGIKAFNSNANFIFLETYDKYNAILKELEKGGIVVKMIGDIEGYTGCIRATVGTKEMNDKFIESIERAI
jgi:histidinol-phosphate aminotransferase